jgi:formylglycine-generating enzyme required for sulfatase activity
VTIDLPGIRSGAKKLELAMLVPCEGSGIAPFYIGKYEITQGQWQAVMGKNPSSFKKGPDYPVETVSWDDVKIFCAKVNVMVKQLPNGLQFRLPTDKEWSWAVGLEDESGNTPQEKSMQIADAFPWGTLWPPTIGAGNYNKMEGYQDHYENTSPVGSFNPNKYGLFDLGGNVWEWCEDWYNPSEAKYRVLRGASWCNGNRDYLLSSYRARSIPDNRGKHAGFRVMVGMPLL